jgi:hypothetical protein
MYMIGLTFVMLVGSALVVGVLLQTSASRGACCVEDGCTSTSEASCANVGGRWLRDRSCATDVCAIPATPAPTVPIVGDPCNITLIDLVFDITNVECDQQDTFLSAARISLVDRRSPACDPLEVTMQCRYLIGFEPTYDYYAFDEIELIPIADIDFIKIEDAAATGPFNVSGSEDLAIVTVRYKEQFSYYGDTASYRCFITSEDYPIPSYGVSPVFPSDPCV